MGEEKLKFIAKQLQKCYWIRMFLRKNLSKPIQEIPEIKGWKEIPIKECGEPLVALGPFSEYPNIFQDSIYFGERQSSPYQRGELDGALLTPFLRKGVADKLEKASKLLPEGYAFLIWDSYRPLSVQHDLFVDYRDQLIEKEGLSGPEANEKAQIMVSIPSDNPLRPSPHNTGGSVDLTIVKFDKQAWAEMLELNKSLQSSDWKVAYAAEMRRWKLLRESTPLDMGGSFDEVADTTATRYYEEKLQNGTLLPSEKGPLENRRMLYNALQAVGLSNYSEEFWHFDHGNQFHAKRTGSPAIYGTANFSEDCQNHEEMRQKNLAGNEALLHTPLVIQSKLGEGELLTLVRQEARRFGEASSQRNHPKAKRLTA